MACPANILTEYSAICEAVSSAPLGACLMVVVEPSILGGQGPPRRMPLRATQPAAIRRPGVVADPAEGFEAASEAPGDARWEPGVRVVEAARQKVAFPGAMQREEPFEPLARSDGPPALFVPVGGFGRHA